MPRPSGLPSSRLGQSSWQRLLPYKQGEEVALGSPQQKSFACSGHFSSKCQQVHKQHSQHMPGPLELGHCPCNCHPSSALSSTGHNKLCLTGCPVQLMCSESTIHLLDAWLAVFCPGALFLLKSSGSNLQGSSTCARDKKDFAFRQICGFQGAHLKPLLQSRTARPALPDHTDHKTLQICFWKWRHCPRTAATAHKTPVL